MFSKFICILNVSRETFKKDNKYLKKKLKYYNIITDTTFIFETGQDWKIAALRINKCVCLFYVKGDFMKKDMVYMREAIKEAKKAYKTDDVPIGAIIVYNDEIIAKAHNQKESKNNNIKHAEIIAIEKACKKLNTWHLEK